MEQEMKVSIATVRRLRTERGWTQEQLAAASGLSLRTIQRVEGDATASVGTRVSLAATFGVPLSSLTEEPSGEKTGNEWRLAGSMFIGMAVLSCVLISESGRLPGLPTSEVLAALNVLLAAMGALLAVPAIVRLLMRRRYAVVALAMLGTPLVLLLVGGLLVSNISGHGPSWQLGALGIGGVALTVLALRELKHASQSQR